MSEVEVRPARPEDIDDLVSGLPDRSRLIHEKRLARQAGGDATYLIARVEDVPVGHLVVNWSGSASAAVRAHLDAARVPDLEDLLVLESRRGLGIGSKLLDEAERLALERGFTRLGVDVALENDGARRLYERRGHRECGLGSYVIRASGVNEDGSAWAWEEEVEYLVRPLEPDRGQDGSTADGSHH